MPIDVDAEQRLADIAAATVAVARERGTRAVTLRAVADQLGRSTAFITNFVPSRAMLMANALEHARAAWDDDRAAELGDLVGPERLAALARWMCTSSPDETVLRSLWIEVIAYARSSDNRHPYEVVRGVTDATYAKFREGAATIERAGRAVELADAERIADILYLYCRGCEVKSVEDPESWTDARMLAALEVLLRTLVFDGSAPPEDAA